MSVRERTGCVACDRRGWSLAAAQNYHQVRTEAWLKDRGHGELIQIMTLEKCEPCRDGYHENCLNGTFDIVCKCNDALDGMFGYQHDCPRCGQSRLSAIHILDCAKPGDTVVTAEREMVVMLPAWACPYCADPSGKACLLHPDDGTINTMPAEQWDKAGREVRRIDRKWFGTNAVEDPQGYRDDIRALLQFIREARANVRLALDTTLLEKDVTARILLEIREERMRQDAKWGEQHHPDGTGPDVMWPVAGRMEHVAREMKRLCQESGGPNQDGDTWFKILAEEVTEAGESITPSYIRQELIQVAAVCVNWITDIDSRGVTE